MSYTAKSEDDDVAQIFLEKLEKDLRCIWSKKKFKDPTNMIFTEKDKRNYDKATKCQATKCHICGKDGFVEGDEKKNKVRDHCHLTNRFSGAAHAECNRNYRIPKFIPVIFHNLPNYDAHLFIKKIFIKNPKERLQKPNNEKKYISFSKEIVLCHITDEKGKRKPVKREIRFIDSFRFMPTSLDALIKNLDPEQCKNLKKFYPDPRKFDLLKRKGVYPYDYVDSVDKLAESSLPPKEAFYSRLNDEETTNEDYEHAKTVWKEFRIKTLGEYTSLYNKVDVLQLADVFENFTDICLENYKLDAAWYYTSPGLAWDDMLKRTGATLELLTDVNMLLMFKNGIRGGVATRW